MKKALALTLALAAGTAGAAAGQFGLGLGVSVFTPPEEGSSLTPLFNGSASYWFTNHVVGSMSVGYARYGIEDVTYSYMPFIPRVTYHFWPGKTADPYVGAGFVYARKWWDGPEEDSANTYGFTGLTGVNFTFGKYFGFGAGVEYVVPDAGDFDSSYPAFMISLGGGNY